MKIERIDEKTVKCFLSNEELEQYEISYKDFVVRSDKAREVVEEIIEQAEEEVGYQPPQFAFDLQIMMLPDKGMILTFSEKDPDEEKQGETLMDCLKEMKELLLDKKAQLEKKKNAEAEGGEKHVKTEAPAAAMFSFENIRNLYEFADALPGTLRVKSVLYRGDDSYYLFLDKGTASDKRYNRTCIQAMEFGALCPNAGSRLAWLEEHGECLIEERALKKLGRNVKTGKKGK